MNETKHHRERGGFRAAGLGRDLMVGIAATLALLLVLLAAGGAFGQTDSSEARAAYRAAQDELDDENYSKAADAFHEVYQDHSDSRYAARALYWEAFALSRQGSVGDLRRAIDVLQLQLEEYPEQARSGDSGELAVYIRELLAERGDARSARAIAELAEQFGAQEEAGKGRYSNEAKMQALHALMQMKPERAMPILREMLLERPDGYSEEMREQALFLLSQSGAEQSADLLVQLIETDPSPKIRETAVFWLAQTDDERALELLQSILRDGSQPDAIREKAIFSISQMGGREAGVVLRELVLDDTASTGLREQAIFWMHQLGGTQVQDFLLDVYRELDAPELREKVIFSVAQMGGEDAAQWLLEVARDEDEDLETRKQALFWSAQTGSVDVGTYRDIFDEVDDPEVREQVIFGLSQMGSEESVDALLDIARNAENKDLREQALFWLGQSDDERAADFLMEIIQEDQ